MRKSQNRQDQWRGIGSAKGTAGDIKTVYLFVDFYEEPTLRGKFGMHYEEYCRNVGRWWPHVRG